MADFAAVLKELQQERDRLDQAIRVLGSLARRSNGSGSLGKRPRRRPLSLAARRKIAAAQRARWARMRSVTSEKAYVGKRVMSIAARRKIAAAQRARWAKVKQQKKAA